MIGRGIVGCHGRAVQPRLEHNVASDLIVDAEQQTADCLPENEKAEVALLCTPRVRHRQCTIRATTSVIRTA